jgi:hypothetical protein
MPHSREEEERGYHIAEEHVCAACLGIVHQWDTLLAKKEQHRGGRRLSAPHALTPLLPVYAWPRVGDSMLARDVYGPSTALQQRAAPRGAAPSMRGGLVQASVGMALLTCERSTTQRTSSTQRLWRTCVTMW